MPRWLNIPKPLLYLCAGVFAVATIFYTLAWMYYVRWQPQAEPIGLTWIEPVVAGPLEVRSVNTESASELAGLRAGDRILAINDREVRSLDPYYDFVVRGRPGDLIRFRFQHAGETTEQIGELQLTAARSKVTPDSAGAIIARELANSYPLLFLIVGLYVLFVRVRDGHAWMLALLFAAFIAGPAYEKIRPVLHPSLRPLTMAYALTFAFLGPSFFYSFFTTFPDSSPIERRVPRLKWVVFAVCAVIALPSAAALLWQGLLYPCYVQWGWMGPGQFRTFSIFALIGFVLFGFAALITNAFEEKDAHARKRFRVVLWGTIVGFGPEVARLVLSNLGYGPARDQWVQLACLALLMLVPSAMAYAVVKHRVLEIPALLRRSARYLIVRRGLDIASLTLMVWIIVYFAGLGRILADSWLQGMRMDGNAADLTSMGPIIFGAGAFIGAVFYQVHQRVRSRYMERVDRAFFRSTYDSRQILQDLAENLRSAPGSDELAGMLEKQLTEALHPQSLAIYFRAGQQLQLARFTPGPIPSSLVHLAPDAPVLKELAQRGLPWEVPPPDAVVPPDLPELGRLREHLAGMAPIVERTDVLAQLVPLQPECLVPVLGRGGELAGLLVLGQRLSEEPYSDEDEKLLAAVAGQAAVALENIHLAEEMATRQAAEAKRVNEMSIAREVQTKLFPQRMPPLQTLDYAGSCDQARTIGGDYYDYLDMGRGRVGLALADISGKGIFAALLMANLQANLRSQYAMALEDLGALMRSVNRLFFESVTPGLYATMFIADYSDAGRRLRYVNCGHNPPLLLRADGKCEQLQATATVVGLLEEWECTVGDVTLAPGDILVIYSDGVTEAASDDGEFFGDERLEATLREYAHLPAAELTKKIATTVHTFSGKEQEDDLTLLVAKAR